MDILRCALTKQKMPNIPSSTATRKNIKLGNELQIISTPVIKEEENDPLYMSKIPEDAFIGYGNEKTVEEALVTRIIKEDPDARFVNIKIEKHEDSQCGTIIHYPEEIYKKSTGHLPECEQDPLDISRDGLKTCKQEILFTDDINKNFTEDIAEKEKPLLKEDIKYDVDTIEHKVEWSDNMDNHLYTRVYEDHTIVNTSKNNGRDSLSDLEESCTRISEDADKGLHHFFRNCEVPENVILLPMMPMTLQGCYECGKVFSRSNYLKRHVIKMHQKTECKCQECSKVFSCMYYLKEHIRVGHNRYECPECHKNYMRKSHLEIHIDSVHKKIKKYECGDCNKIFSRSYDLTRHIRTVHQKIKRYQCKLCSRMFYRKPHLEKHNNRVHKE